MVVPTAKASGRFPDQKIRTLRSFFDESKKGPIKKMMNMVTSIPLIISRIDNEKMPEKDSSFTWQSSLYHIIKHKK